jgi:NADPH-dependent curcumin reductase CurA
MKDSKEKQNDKREAKFKNSQKQIHQTQEDEQNASFVSIVHIYYFSSDGVTTSCRSAHNSFAMPVSLHQSC